MKRTYATAIALGLTAGLVTACGDDHDSVVANPTPTTQSLDTAQVLAIAQTTSETSTPFAVDGGALTLTDTSETSEPITVNAM